MQPAGKPVPLSELIGVIADRERSRIEKTQRNQTTADGSIHETLPQILIEFGTPGYRR